ADVPHTPRANFIYTAAGPAVNVLLCLAAVLLLAACGYVPSFNPIADPYSLPLTNWSDGTTVVARDGHRLARYIAVKDGDKRTSAADIVPARGGDGYVMKGDAEKGIRDKPVEVVRVKPEDVVVVADKEGKLKKDAQGNAKFFLKDEDKDVE